MKELCIQRRQGIDKKHLYLEVHVYLHINLEESNCTELTLNTITLGRDNLGKAGKLPSFPMLPLQLASAVMDASFINYLPC